MGTETVIFLSKRSVKGCRRAPIKLKNVSMATVTGFNIREYFDGTQEVTGGFEEIFKGVQRFCDLCDLVVEGLVETCGTVCVCICVSLCMEGALSRKKEFEEEEEKKKMKRK